MAKGRTRVRESRATAGGNVVAVGGGTVKLRVLFSSMLLVSVALAKPAAAQEQQTFKFTGVSGYTGFGYYVGPYYGQILSVPGQPTIDLYCVDFLHRISMNQVWKGWMTPLSGNLQYTRGGNGAYGLYLRAAWLTQQYYKAPTSEIKHIQATIWNLFGGGPTPSSNYWLNLANQNYTSVNPNYFRVITPVNAGDGASAQEFLTYVTPEPETYAMFATGLCLLAWMAYRRRRAFTV